MRHSRNGHPINVVNMRPLPFQWLLMKKGRTAKCGLPDLAEDYGDGDNQYPV